MKTHIDFFPANVTDWNKKRFSEKDNMTSIPDRHQEIFRTGFSKIKDVDVDNRFLIIVFYKEDTPKPVFKYITHTQFQELKVNINWRDTQTRGL